MWPCHIKPALFLKPATNPTDGRISGKRFGGGIGIGGLAVIDETHTAQFAQNLTAMRQALEGMQRVLDHARRKAKRARHRIGRTGRAGVAGQAISFVTPAGAAHFALIQKRCQLNIAVEVVEGFETTDTVPTPEGGQPNATGGIDPNGGVKGKRLSKKDKLRAQKNAGSDPA